VPGLLIGEQITCFYDGLTIITFHGKLGRIFWFVIRKMDRVYQYPDVPRFSTHDAEEVCEGFRQRRVWREVLFRHIWDRREVFSMTALEENVFSTWHFGRIVCFGDSMHKVSAVFLHLLIFNFFS
jgi:FAD dependent monooxygenase